MTNGLLQRPITQGKTYSSLIPEPDDQVYQIQDVYSAHNSTVVEKACDKIMGFSKMEKNWDLAGADVITEETIRNACNILEFEVSKVINPNRLKIERIFVAPASDEGIVVEMFLEENKKYVVVLTVHKGGEEFDLMAETL